MVKFKLKIVRPKVKITQTIPENTSSIESTISGTLEKLNVVISNPKTTLVSKEFASLGNFNPYITKIAVKTPGTQGPAGAGAITGGSVGQHLAKASGADYDIEWVNPPTTIELDISSPVDKDLLIFDAASNTLVNQSTIAAEIATFSGEETLDRKTINAGYF